MPSTVTLVIVYFFEILIYFFHLSVLILMIVKRKNVFKGPFFNVFRTILIADLICYIALMVVQKLPDIPSLIDFYKSNIYFGTAAFEINTYGAALQFLGHSFLALNRFTIIWFPLKHKNIWRQQWYTVVLIVLPFLIISWRIHQPMIYTFNENGSFYVNFVNTYITSITALISTILMLHCSFVNCLGKY